MSGGAKFGDRKKADGSFLLNSCLEITVIYRYFFRSREFVFVLPSHGQNSGPIRKETERIYKTNMACCVREQQVFQFLFLGTRCSGKTTLLWKLRCPQMQPQYQSQHREPVDIDQANSIKDTTTLDQIHLEEKNKKREDLKAHYDHKILRDAGYNYEKLRHAGVSYAVWDLPGLEAWHLFPKTIANLVDVHALCFFVDPNNLSDSEHLNIETTGDSRQVLNSKAEAKRQLWYWLTDPALNHCASK